MLGVRAFGLGIAGVARQEQEAQIDALGSQVAALRATALVLPPVFRSALMEEADALLAELDDLRGIATSGTPNVAQQSRLITRLTALPGEIQRLEANLSDAAELAARIEIEGEEAVLPGAPAGPQARAQGIAGLALGAGAVAMAGLGIWLST